VNALGTILGVWAHPDDETYLSAGLMARAVQAGDRVVCVTATRGEAGSTDEVRWPPSELAAVRTEELALALAELGVTEHIWLDYPDGGCEDIDADEAAARIAAIIEEVRPDTILTFGPDGMTGHHDHRTVCEWTTRAVERLGLPPGTLHYATNSPDWMETSFRMWHQLGAWMEGEPPVTERADMSIDITMDDDLLDQKIRAINAQVSQSEPLIAAVGAEKWRSEMRAESFRPA
jgi:LmbE family N-acetylglucosaminyl deacetylase